jgi:hypothetical protein
MSEIDIGGGSDKKLDLEKNSSESFSTSNGLAGYLYYDNINNRQVYVTFRDKRNMYQKNQSWAVSTNILNKLENRNVDTIFIFSDNDLYVHDIDDYWETDVELNYSSYDPQKAPNKEMADYYEGVASSIDRYPDDIKVNL